MTRVKKSTPARVVAHPSLGDFPGHRIRRLQQAAVATFTQDEESAILTPVQFAVLYTLQSYPGVDQRTLAKGVRFDTSTIGGVIDRLEARGLLSRSFSAEDRRVRLLNLTQEGAELIAQVTPAVLRAQARILDPLSAAERLEFMRMMAMVIAHHEPNPRAE